MKKIIVFSVVLFLIFVIYLCNMDNKIYYLAIGNSGKYTPNNNYSYSFYVSDYLKEKNLLEKYLYEYSDYDKKIIDIINDIKDNKKIGNSTLKNSLIKADLVTLFLDDKDLSRMISDGTFENEIYDYIDELTLDFEKLVKLMREYCKEDIIFIGLYNSFGNKKADKIVDYYNKRFKELCSYYDIMYVIPKKVLLNDIYSKLIAADIIEVINKKILRA